MNRLEKEAEPRPGHTRADYDAFVTECRDKGYWAAYHAAVGDGYSPDINWRMLLDKDCDQPTPTGQTGPTQPNQIEQKWIHMFLDQVAEFFDVDSPVHPGCMVEVDGQDMTMEELLRKIRLHAAYPRRLNRCVPNTKITLDNRTEM